MDKDGKNDGKEGRQALTGGLGQAVGGYGGLSAAAWENGRKAWRDTPQGRLAIRAFSRGVMGAAFFTAGGLLTRRWMHSDTGDRYIMNEPWSKQILPSKGGNPLKFIAKLIDTVAGKPIEVTVRAVTGSEQAAMRSVRFRSSKFLGDFHNSGYRGRGLGNEVVNVTFDFFCASVGDAFGRDIAGWFDPNVKKKWIKDGHIDFPKAVKQALTSVTHYVAYNGGEDWAVGIPYAYFMKANRHLIDRYSRGFDYDADRNINGSGFKVRDGKIVGNFNMEGAFDLHTRFTVYNIGTLMYRELWDYFGRKIKGKPAVLYGDPDPAHAGQRGWSVGNLFKWMARSAVKAGVYMQFAVPFFWITRASQGNYRGVFIDPDRNAVLCYQNPNAQGKVEVVYANDLTSGAVTANTKVFWARHEPVYGNPHALQFKRLSGELTGKDNPIHHWGGESFKPFDPKLVNTIGDKWVLQPAGRLTRGLAEKMDDVTKHFEGSVLAKPVKKALMLNPEDKIVSGRKISADKFSRFNHGFVNAAVSYTPYMYMKAEAARLWDDGKMDLAAERMIDGAAGLNWGEFRAGVGEVWNAFLHKPLPGPGREEEAQRRKLLDTSLPDDVNLGDRSYYLRRRYHSVAPDWRQRLIHGPKPEIGANEPKSHVEREKMRQALEDLHPPTPSIN